FCHSDLNYAAFSPEPRPISALRHRWKPIKVCRHDVTASRARTRGRPCFRSAPRLGHKAADVGRFIKTNERLHKLSRRRRGIITDLSAVVVLHIYNQAVFRHA
ncbi:uncharacterized, partial [Tachysurus ichikawai]